jgi:Ni/Fe-hydrogenase subunit HybB-like protein
VLVVVFAFVRSRPTLRAERRVFLYRCVCWLVGGFALTMFLPVRSSLYALFPSVGAALAATTLTSGWWDQFSTAPKRGLIAVALVVPLALFPIYRSRGERWFLAARLSSSVTTQLVQHLTAHPDAHGFVLQDDRSTRANLANAFGPAASDVASLYFERPVSLRIEPTPVTQVSSGELLLVLDGRTGQLRRVPVD